MRIYVYLGLLALALALVFIIYSTFMRTSNDTPPQVHGKKTEQVKVPVPGSALQVFGSIPYWDQARAVAVFKKNVEAFDIISVFWYRLDEDGSIKKYRDAREDAMLIEYAHENGVKVLALIANLPEEGEWDADAVDAAIRESAKRAAHVAEIVALVQAKGFDGVNIDYEMLRDSQTEDFSAFIAELAAALHRKGKILSVAIHAQEHASETRGQDLVALQAADILSFMTYDEHWETGEPGPVASLPWVRGVLEHALFLGVNPKKIFLGIPLYGYDWPEERRGYGDAAGLEYEEIVAIANEGATDIVFDAESETPHFSYESDGTTHEVWFENAKSFGPKIELAKEFGVGGVMFWRQGREDTRIYDILKEVRQ